jgi:ribonuclease R
MPNRKGVLLLSTKLDFVAGKVSGHRDGFGFLLRDEGGPDIFLSPREMQKVLHGDRVLVRITGTDTRGRPEGTIVEVTERRTNLLVGRLVSERGVTLVVPEDQRIKHDILIPPTDVMTARPGQVVSVEILEQPSRYSQPIGRVVEILGQVGDPGMEIEIAVRKFDVPHEFSDEALADAQTLPDEVRFEDLAGRVDLRDVPMVTIDGEDARDFDDAVYCEAVGSGKTAGWRLIVAIADVSHYVVDGTALDRDAITRGTSVYFPRRVIPMLPEKISNGLCSLNPEVDRLTLVCDAVIGPKGAIKAYQFYNAVIHSAARLTYSEVWEALSDAESPAAQRRAGVLPQLNDLYDLYKTLLDARIKRGAMELETTETMIVSDAQGKIEKIMPRRRNDAHRLIEECMLAANVCAADFLARAKHPGLYRIHEGPTPEKLANLKAFLKTLNLTLGGGNDPSAQDYANLVASIAGRPDRELLQSMILRSMQQAVYGPHNTGHFGLAYKAYAHFTSPIRRYPDLLVHRVIKALLAGHQYVPPKLNPRDLETGRQRSAGKPASASAAHAAAASTKRKSSRKEQPEAVDADDSALSGKVARSELLSHWEQLGMWLSSTERRADEASRDVEAWLKCFFMKERVGDAFAGRITGVAPFGVFVTLDALFVEGLVHVSELGNEYFHYNEAMHELRGERSGRRFHLTDDIHVQVARVDLEARRIEFRLVQGTSYRDMVREAKTAATQGKAKAAKKGADAQGKKAPLDADLQGLAPVFPPEAGAGDRPGNRGQNKRKAADASRERTNAQKKRKAALALQRTVAKPGSKTKSKASAAPRKN